MNYEQREGERWSDNGRMWREEAWDLTLEKGGESRKRTHKFGRLVLRSMCFTAIPVRGAIFLCSLTQFDRLLLCINTQLYRFFSLSRSISLYHPPINSSHSILCFILRNLSIFRFNFTPPSLTIRLTPSLSGRLCFVCSICLFFRHYLFLFSTLSPISYILSSFEIFSASWALPPNLCRCIYFLC